MADAWALTDSTRNGARATLSSNIIVGANSGDYIEFDLEGFAGNEADTFRLTGISSSFSEVVEIKPTILTVKGNNTAVNFNLTRPPINTRFSARVERVGTDTFSVFLNGVFIANATLANNLTIEQFFGLASFTNQTFVGAIYSIEASTSGGTPTNRWINRTSGTGSVWTDEIGGNDATLNTDFPTDGSQWILYDDGGAATQTVTTTSIASAESFGSPNVFLTTQFISPNEIPTQEAFGVVNVGIILPSIQPASIPSQEAFGNAVIENFLQRILPSSIGSELTFGKIAVVGGDLIIIPVASRATWNNVAKYLRTLGFKGSDNDVICAWLRSAGFEYQYNDMWNQYLIANGFTEGALTDKYNKWKRGE